MNHNQRNNGHNRHRDVLKAALDNPDSLTLMKLKHNKKVLRLGRDDELLYDFEPQIKKPVNVIDYDESKHKSMEPEQALEAYKALPDDHKSFIKALHSDGLIPGLRSLTYVKTDDGEWPQQQEDIFKQANS